MKTVTPTTIFVDVLLDEQQVEIGLQEVIRWLDAADSREIADLDIDVECASCAAHNEAAQYANDQDDDDTAIRINCGSDAGSLHDLQRIQELCNGLHVSDILARLAA